MAVDATYSIPQAPNIFKTEAPIRINMSKILYAVHRLGPRECRRQIISILPSLTESVKTAFNSRGTNFALDEFDICGTVHHHSINKNNQREAACIIRLYYALW